MQGVLFVVLVYIDGVKQEANHVIATVTIQIVMNLNLIMYFKAICHIHVWWFTQFYYHSTTVGKAHSLHEQ